MKHVGLKWFRRGGWRLEARCVDGTYYVKNVQPIIIGNSMLDYAMTSLEGVKPRGGMVLAAA